MIKISKLIQIFLVVFLISFTFSDVNTVHGTADYPLMGVTNTVESIDSTKIDDQELAGENQIRLKGANFETPTVSTSTTINESPSSNWQTTSTTPYVRYYPKGWMMVPSTPSSSQVARVNASSTSGVNNAIYQDVDVTNVPRDRVLHYNVWVQSHDFSGVSTNSVMNYYIGVPGIDTNSNETSTVVSGSKLSQSMNTPRVVSRQYSYTGMIPADVNNTMRVALSMSSGGAYVDNVEVYVESPPSFTSTINIIENVPTSNTVDVNAPSTIEISLNRQVDSGDVAWTNEVLTVELPAGATIPTNASIKYDSNTQAIPLQISNVNGNTFDLTGFDDSLNWNTATISFETKFDLNSGAEQMVFANYKYQAAPSIDGTLIDYNVWGVDKTNVISSYFTVAFDANGGVLDASTTNQTIVTDNLIAEPVAPTRVGYTFGGWSTTPDSSGKVWDFTTDKMPANNLTLYAKWIPAPPTVNPMNPGDTCITGTGTPGDTIYFYDKDGVLIGSTKVNENGTYSSCEADNNIPIGPGDITIETETPNGEVSTPVKMYLFTYDVNGTTESINQSMYVEEGKTPTMTTNPKYTGYTFGGWNDKKSNGLAYDFTMPVTVATTVYAQWDVYEGVTVDPMEPGDTCVTGKGEPGDIVYFYNEAGDVIGETVVGEDGTYSSCDQNGLDPQFPIGPGDISVGSENPDNGAISVPKKLYLVTFDMNGSTDTDNYSIYVEENTTTKQPVNPLYVGYAFDGWFDASVDGVAFDFTTPITEKTTIYAQWSEYSGVTIDPMEPGDTCVTGTGEPGDIVYFYNEAGDVIGETVVGENGTYSSCDENGLNPQFPIGPGDIGIGSEKPGNGGVSVPKKLHLVTFDMNGSTDTDNYSIYVEENKTTTQPVNPLFVGYTFDGWFNASIDGVAFDFSTPITGKTTIYAQWSEYSGVTIDPMEPGDTCVTGTGEPGDIVYFYNEAGDVIGETVVGKDGTYSSCDENGLNPQFPIGPGDIGIGSEKPGNGGVSVPKKLHLVTFDMNGSTDTDNYSIYVEENKTTTQPVNPLFVGYTFDGWFDASVDGVAFDFTTPITGKTTIYAQWSEYSGVTIDPMEPGDTCVTGKGEPGDIVYFYNEAGDVIGQTVVGEDGTYSSCDENGLNPQFPIGPGDISVGSENPDNGAISVPKNLYLVTFDMNGSTNADNYSIYVEENTTTPQPENPTYEGYAFEGWFNKSSLGFTFDFSKPITESTIIYAQWSEYSGVTIDPMEPGDTCVTGTGEPGDIVYFYNEAGDVIGETVVGDDGTYSSCDENGLNPQFPIGPGDIGIGSEKPGNGGISVPKKLHLVTYDMNGSTNTDNYSIYVEENKTTEQPANPNYDGYTFDGWFDVNGSEFNFANPITEKTTIYAHWSEYSGVIIDPMEPGDTCVTGTGEPGDIVYFYNEAGDVIGQTVVGDDGTYSSCDEDGLNPQFPIGPGDIGIGSERPDNGGVSVPKKLYLVTYDMNGSTEVGNYSIYVEENTTTSQPANPVYSQYTFDGWFDASVNGSEFDFTTPINEATTIYAQWTFYEGITIDPMEPGDTCVTGTGAPGDTVYFYDELGNVIGQTTVDGNGNYSSCDEDGLNPLFPIGPGDISVGSETPDGVTSIPKVLHLVTFDTNGSINTPTKTLYVESGKTVDQPDDPIYLGHTFLNWDTEINSKIVFDFSTPITEPTTIYAKWSIDDVIVDPMNPGETCLTGEAAPGGTINIIDEEGNIIGTGIVDENGNFEICELYPNGDVDVEVTDPEGNTSNPVHLHTVTFDTNGANSATPGSIYVEEGKSFAQPIDPTKDGNIFDFWSLSNDTKEWNFQSDVMGTESITLYAQWSALTYQLNFDINGADSSVIPPQFVEWGMTTTPPVDPFKEGYSFVGWSTTVDVSETIVDFTTDTMPANDVTLYAQWVANEYNVSYNVNGGDSLNPADEVVAMDSLITEPITPTREGYTFMGWSLEATSTTSMWDFANDTMPANDITLYAQWGVDTYNVMFDVNGGESNPPSTQIVEFGGLISEPNVPKKTGYEFVGWNTSADGTGSMWSFTSSTMPQGDITLYAQWEIVDYTMSYDTNGGVTSTPASETLHYGEYATEPNIPEKTGYEFNGWNKMRDGLGLFWDFITMTMPDEDVELYADWKIGTPSVDPLEPGNECMSGSDGVPGATIEVTDIFGNVVGTTTVKPDGTWEYCGEIVTDPDDIFVNQVDPDGNTSDKVDVIKPSSYFMVYFNTNGATSDTPAPQSVKIGNRVSQPINPIKPGYTFEGWYTIDNVQWIFGVNMMPAEDVILNAKWSIDKPIVNPINPGDTCVTGVGAPGSTAFVYDEFGNVIGTTIVGADGTFSYCDASIGEEGEISIELTDKDGNTSNRVTIRKPGSGIVNVLPETGENSLEKFIFGFTLIFTSLYMSFKLNRK